MLNKKATQMMIEALMITFVALILGGTTLYANEITSIMTNTEPEDVTSIRSFENLVEQIEILLDEPGAYAYRENIPFELSEKFAVVGFDKDDDEVPFYSLGFSRDYKKADFLVKNNMNFFPKPSMCEGSCLCLIKVKEVSSSFSKLELIKDRYDIQNAQCVNFERDVIFTSSNDILFYNNNENSQYFSILTKGGYNFLSHNFAGFKNIDNNYYRINNVPSNLFIKDQYINGLFLAGEIPSDGQQESRMDFSKMSSLSLFIDLVDQKNIKNQEESLILFLTPKNIVFNKYVPRHLPRYSSFSDFLSYNNIDYEEEEKPFSVPNIIVDFRKQALSHLAYKDPDMYYSFISNSKSPDELLGYFIEYLEWTQNDMLHKQDAKTRQELMLMLSGDALKKVKQMIDKYGGKDSLLNCSNKKVENHTKCKEINEFAESYETLEVKDEAGKDKKGKEALIQDIIRWIAVAEDKDPEQMILLDKIEKKEEKEEYGEAYEVFLDYADDKEWKSYDEEFPEVFERFKKALRIHEMNDGDLVHRKTVENVTIEGDSFDSIEYNIVKFFAKDGIKEYIYAPGIPVVEEIDEGWRQTIDNSRDDEKDFFNEYDNELAMKLLFNKINDVKKEKLYMLEEFKLIKEDNFEGFEIKNEETVEKQEGN